MPKFKIRYSGTHNPKEEEVTADMVADVGHEGRWVDFTKWNADAGSDELVLRVRAAEVSRVDVVG